MRSKAPVVLVIAGVDPSGGAGILADMRSLESAGVRGVGAITALTVQTEHSFLDYQPTSPGMLRDTIRSMYEAFPIAAVKIGMLATGPVAETVAELLPEIKTEHVVIDPVIVAAVGARLVDEEAEAVLRDKLAPMATLLTPNMAEAAALTGLEVKDIQGMKVAAEELRKRGCSAVVVTGGHLGGDAVDVLATADGISELRAKRLPGSVHGTGCAFSSAAAAGLAKGLSLLGALTAAKAHVESLFKHEIWRTWK